MERHSRLKPLMLAACAAVAACGRKVAPDESATPSASSKGSSSNAKVVAASPSASAPPLQAPGQPAGDVLRVNPTLAFEVPEAWLDRMVGEVKGYRPEPGTDSATKEWACPAMKTFSPKDEFDRKDGEAKLLAACRTENLKAIEFAKSYPHLATLYVNVTAFDFQAKAYHLEACDHDAMGRPLDIYATANGRAYFADRYWSLAWDGVYPASRGREEVCLGPLGDQLRANSGMKLDLPMSEADARLFKEKLPEPGEGHTAIQAAIVFDGTKASDKLACGVEKIDTPTGRVLAWRLIVPSEGDVPMRTLTDWISIGTWTPPGSPADDARKFFGVTASGAANGEAGCACKLGWKWKRATDWFPVVLNAFDSKKCGSFKSQHEAGVENMGDKEIAYMRTSLANGKKRVASLRDEVEKSSACKGEEKSREAMLALLKRIEAAQKSWDDALAAEHPTEAGLDKANGSSCGLWQELRLKTDCESGSTGKCAFGCPEGP